MQTAEHDSGRQRTAVIVDGMHRSGTSTMARMISLLGAALPVQPTEAPAEGPRGAVTDRAIVDFDDVLLDRFGSWWSGWDSIDPDELTRLVRMVERARRLVAEQFAGEDLVILEDPRVSRLLPLWMRALEREGFRCVHVLALRHPGAVANSLGRRDGLSRKATALSWLAHSMDAELHSRPDPRVVVSFESLPHHWRAEIDRMSRALALEWPTPPDEIAHAVEEVIEPRLAHESTISVPKGPISAIVPVYEVFRRWSKDDIQPGDAEALDSWRVALEPIRRQRSAVANIARERREVIADAQIQKRRSAGRLGSAEVWSPIQRQAYNVEADTAWAWLMRERRHAREANQAQQRPAPGQRGAAYRTIRKVLPSPVRRLGRRLPLLSGHAHDTAGRGAMSA